MNKSKQMMQSDTVAKKKGKKEKKGNKDLKQSNLTAKVIIAVATIFVIMISVIIGYDILHKETMVTVGEKKFNINDMMYQIYATETTYEQTAQMYNSLYSQMGQEFDYWTEANDSGVTNESQARNEAMNNVIFYEIMNLEATSSDAAKYTLTAEEKTSVDEKVNELLTQLPKYRLRKTGFTKKYLTTVLEQKTIGDRYYTDLIDSFDVDDAAIKEGINQDEYKQYNIEYIVRSKQIDDAGQSVTLEDTQLNEVKAKMNEYLTQAKAGKTLKDLVTTADQEKQYGYNTGDFIDGSEENTLDQEIMDAALALKNEEVADKIIETEQAYYVIKMVDNASMEAYDEAVASAIDEAEQSVFQEAFTQLKEKYSVTTNLAEWNKLDFGTITLDKGEALTKATAAPAETTGAAESTDAAATSDTSATDSAATTAPETTE